MKRTSPFDLRAVLKALPSIHREALLLCTGALVLAGLTALTQRSLTRSSPDFLSGALCSAALRMLASSIEGSKPGTRPTTSIETLSCQRLPHAPGKSVTTALVTFPPLALSPAHRHPGSVTAYVVKGSIRSQMQGSTAHTYAVGSTWFEPPKVLHVFAENPSATETAELLAVFVADDDCGPLVIPEPSS
jgi:quercetin dioxygenase-like cupin family protein